MVRFLSNLFNYLANVFLVETLSNSRTFQRFAITSNELMNQLLKKGEVTKSDLGEKASTFSKAFREEMTKEWRQQQQQSQRVKK